MRNIGRWGLLFAGALTMLCAVLAAPSIHDPGGGAVLAQAAFADATMDGMGADLAKSIAVLEAIDVEPAMPATSWSIAAIAGDGLDLTKRVQNIEHGGRVKSARTLVVSPASRFSLRI
jgi:hypothetical protein